MEGCELPSLCTVCQRRFTTGMGDTMHDRGSLCKLAQEQGHSHGHASFGRSTRDRPIQDRPRGLWHAYAGANGVKLDQVCSCGLKRATAAPSLLKGSCVKGPCCLGRVHARSGGPWRADAGSDNFTHARSGELKPGWAGSAGRGANVQPGNGASKETGRPRMRLAFSNEVTLVNRRGQPKISQAIRVACLAGFVSPAWQRCVERNR